MMAEPVALRAEIERAASGGGVVDQAAGAFGELVVRGIARAVEGDSLVDEQGDAGAQGDGSGEECRVCGVGASSTAWDLGQRSRACWMRAVSRIELLLTRDSISPLVAAAVVKAAFSVM